jgi:hypothetical protein
MHYHVQYVDELMWQDNRLETTATGRYRGQRMWMLCPECGRRCGKLYLPPEASWFGCRDCHDLTYRSSQESGTTNLVDVAVAADMGITVKQAKRMLDARFRPKLRTEVQLMSTD